MYRDYCIIGAYISFFCTNEWWAITGNNILCFFEATLQPLCSADRVSGIFCTVAKALFIAVKVLSTAAKICGCCSPALLQLFCSASWSHSAALQQRCWFRTGDPIRTNYWCGTIWNCFMHNRCTCLELYVNLINFFCYLWKLNVSL